MKGSFLVLDVKKRGCVGCRHEFFTKDGVLHCALGEKYGIRCTKWGKPK